MPTLPPPIASVQTPRWGARLYHALLGATWLAVAVPLAVWGLDYYLTPLGLRPDHPQDALFRPTGLVGNRLGLLGTAMIAFGVAMYMTRKRWRRLQGVGKLRDWLSFHIWLCTLGPFLILLHTSFKVGGIVSIAFWSMVVVVASGVLGRYVYVHIPKTMGGQFLEMREIEAAQQAIADDLAAAGVPSDVLGAVTVAPPEATPGLLRSLGVAWRSDRSGRRAVRRLREATQAAGAAPEAVRAAVEGARRYRRLAVGRAVLAPFGRLFRYWHAVHLPLALVMAFILLVHIGVAVLFGYAWTSAPSTP